MRLTKLLKRQMSKVLCAALVLSSVTVAGKMQEAEAASKTEIETYGTTLTLNKTATGVLRQEDEQDWYIFDITERGYFTIDLKRDDSADTDKIHYGWKCSLYHDNDIVNTITSTDSITNSYEGKELPLPEGRYYICVEASDTFSDREPLDCPYDVCVNFTAAEEWEDEYNDTSATPNPIEVNKIYLGNLHKEDDVDWYKATTSGNGKIQLDFSPDNSTNVDDIHSGWKITIFDGKLNIMREYTTQTELLPQILPYEKGDFYIKVEASDTFSDREPLNCIYNLQLNFTTTTDWETEYNNEYATADTITSGSECHGLLSWEDDEDWYRINNETNVTATVRFRVDDSVSVDDVSYGWNVVVYNVDREKITEMIGTKKTTTEEEIRIPKGAAYIQVLANDTYSDREPLDCIYHLTVTTIPVHTPAPGENPDSSPTVTPDNPTEPGSSSKPSTTNQSGGSSNEVMQKAITTSKVTTRTVTSRKKKSVYLRWKKQKYAGGYEIYRSTKKKKGYKKVKTIKGGSKVSWTDKKVKGGKNYYYKVRAFQSVADAYIANVKSMGKMSIPNITREFVEENVIMVMINTESNKELLKGVPHREINDCSVIYRVVFQKDDKGMQWKNAVSAWTKSEIIFRQIKRV